MDIAQDCHNAGMLSILMLLQQTPVGHIIAFSQNGLFRSKPAATRQGVAPYGIWVGGRGEK